MRTPYWIIRAEDRESEVRWFQIEFLNGRIGFQVAPLVPEEETGPRGLQIGRPQNESDLPFFGKEVAVKLEIDRRKEDLRTVMRMIPSERRQPGEVGVGWGPIQNAGEAQLILYRKREGRTGQVFAVNRTMGLNVNRIRLADSKKHAADFHAAARYGVKSLDCKDADFVQNGRRDRYTKRAFWRRPEQGL